MSSLAQFKNWYQKNFAAIRADYFEFLKFKSISADPDAAKEMTACAEWLCRYLSTKAGMNAECIETPGYPLVYAENCSAGAKAPTVLIYGHYDVQPVDPIELWASSPFEPTEREGKVFARGAVDDKGQIFYAILAVRAWRELGRQLPINLKFCIEGEEESASMGLAKSLPRLKEKLKADSLLVVDFDGFDAETPALTLGARGLAALEVTLTGSKSDLHSGMHGGIAYNPNRALVELLAKLWDEQGRVRVEGFYKDVVEMSEEERTLFKTRIDKERYSKEFGAEAFGGEKDRSLDEANYLRPTLEINGMFGGYTGVGIKTVIPSQASAKITCRLVPNQNSAKILEQIAAFLKKHVVPGMKIAVDLKGGEPSFRGNPNAPLAKAVASACSEVTGRPCQNVLSGGSIPIVAKMVEVLKTEVVGMGYGLPTDQIHAPNEHFDFSRFEKGFLTVARTLEIL